MVRDFTHLPGAFIVQSQSVSQVMAETNSVFCRVAVSPMKFYLPPSTDPSYKSLIILLYFSQGYCLYLFLIFARLWWLGVWGWCLGLGFWGCGFQLVGPVWCGAFWVFRVGALSYLFRLLSCLKPLIVFTY